MARIRYVGADGCKRGAWACVCIDDAGNAGFEVVESTAALWARFNAAERILLDVPIGLSPGAERRGCDLAAKRLLGRANSRVFLTPPRSALSCGEWDEANRLCKATTGHGVSKQTWAIVTRVREVDEFLRTTPEARSVIRECHPEVCVWGLSGAESGGVIGPPKKTEEGAAFRIGLAERFIPESRAIVEGAMAGWRRRDVGRDDVIDALLAAATAAGGEDRLRTLPAVPGRDGEGLAMEMVYRAG